MNFLNALEQSNTILNSKGGKYYASSYDSNLDLFSGISRYDDKNKIISTFSAALMEDEKLALANLLYLLDIRSGKGERNIFKNCFSYLISYNKDYAKKILSFIPSLGRFDYILQGLNSDIEEEVLKLIKDQITKDLNSETPSLLAKWLPSLRTHNKNSSVAKTLVKKLGLSEKEYRKTLSFLRSKINIVEKNITNRTYNNINFEHVPSKAMLKYKNSFLKNIENEYKEYLASLSSGFKKVNTSGLFCYEIIKKVLSSNETDILLDTMWKSQKDVLQGIHKNVLVVADTSGSMTYPNMLPYSTSLGLAIYTSERNTGVFKNSFITFSDRPVLQKIKGKTIYEKVHNIRSIVAETNIDKVFELLLITAKNNKLKQNDFPSHIIIISDMEFDEGVYSQEGTNFLGWKKAFEKEGYKLPIIIFWNVASFTNGLPITKYDNDVVMVSGFSTNILDNLLTLEKYNPIDCMKQTLEKYVKMLNLD